MLAATPWNILITVAFWEEKSIPKMAFQAPSKPSYFQQTNES